MHYLQGLVAACLLATGSAYAAHATLSPPPGWSAGGSAAWATPSNSFAAQTANQWINNAAKTSAMLNAGGKQVAINATLKLAPSAPKIIAALIFQHPYLRAGVGIASWLGAGKVVYDAASGAWSSSSSSGEGTVSDGYEYQVFDWYPWRPTAEQACNDVGDNFNQHYAPYEGWGGEVSGGSCYLLFQGKRQFGYGVPPLRQRSNTSCPAGWYVTPAGCTQTPQPGKPLTQEEMVELLNPANTPGWPMPDSVPNELPTGTPLPVELPIVNPSTGVNPFPKPQFIPTGDPVRNPNYDPSKPQTADNQPFIQPGMNVTPRPTITNPWQVDIQPVERPQAGAEPLPESELNPDIQDGDNPKDEDTKSLCEKHPDILACQKVKLGDIEAQPLSRNTVSLQINREEGFGPANGACPAPKEFMVMGKAMAFRWDLLCDFATQIRPLLVGFAYLSAALAFFGLSRRD